MSNLNIVITDDLRAQLINLGWGPPGIENEILSHRALMVDLCNDIDALMALLDKKSKRIAELEQLILEDVA